MILLLVAAIILIIIIGFNRYKIKGAIGESRISAKLHRLPRGEYEVINNLLIRKGGRSSQIDHVVVSIYGIFVIETKNYSGWIHGNEHSEYWTQSIYSQKTKFRNPIRQNLGHVSALKSVLADYNNVVYNPIVVFTGSGELKNVYTETPVIYGWELFRTIRNHSGERCLSFEQVEQITHYLNEINVQDRGTKKEHVRQARNQAYRQQWKENALICPRCGAGLVVRNGQYGRFYGCPNYPKCRYTQQF